jgi:predicted PurR-regulated permease PerM
MTKVEFMKRDDYARVVFIVLLLGVLYSVVRILRPFFAALAWAAILATAFHPLFRWLARHLQRRRLASAFTCVLVTVSIVMPLILLVVLLAEQSVEAYRLLETKINSGQLAPPDLLRHLALYQWLRGKMLALGLPEPGVREIVVWAVRLLSQFLVGSSTAIFSGFTHFVFTFFVTLLSLYYLFLRGPEILGELRRLSPLRPEKEEVIILKFKEVVLATLQGSLLTSLVQGAAGGLVFFFFALPSPLLWGTVMAFLSLVPVVGTALVWGPVVAYYLFSGLLVKGLALLAIAAGVVGSIDNFVKPLLIRRRAELHTLWVFLGVLGGVSVFGFLGFILDH